jgi:3-hydroxy acid dehydrogenase/malonic semialdehyde reductase
MLSLKNKIVFITGASSGIGKACAEQFAALGAKLILTARRFDKITELANQLSKKNSVAVLPLQLDVQNNEAVKKLVAQLSDEWKDIYLLINNAGLALTTDYIQDAKTENWDTMIDTNVKGLLYVTRAILPGMVARNSGHIVNMGSITGREYYPGGNVYTATKHAVKAISKSLRLDLLGTPIRVSEIAPGAVETEFSEVRWNDKERAKAFYADFTPLVADDIADAIVYCTTRPLHVNVAEILITPTCQASSNHFYRAGKPVKDNE